jgi:hypothetical protein
MNDHDDNGRSSRCCLHAVPSRPQLVIHNWVTVPTIFTMTANKPPTLAGFEFLVRSITNDTQIARNYKYQTRLQEYVSYSNRVVANWTWFPCSRYCFPDDVDKTNRPTWWRVNNCRMSPVLTIRKLIINYYRRHIANSHPQYSVVAHTCRYGPVLVLFSHHDAIN